MILSVHDEIIKQCAENSNIINITNNYNNNYYYCYYYCYLYTDAVTNTGKTQKLRTTNNKHNQYQLTSSEPKRTVLIIIIIIIIIIIMTPVPRLSLLINLFNDLKVERRQILKAVIL